MSSMPKLRPFTAEEDAAIRQSAEAGEPAGECAQRLGRSRNAVLGRALRLKPRVQFQRVNQNPGFSRRSPREEEPDAPVTHATVVAKPTMPILKWMLTMDQAQ